MPGFTQVFGGNTVAQAQTTFLALTMDADITLAWPIEQAINGNVVADTIEVDASVPGLAINLPDARQATTGYTTCINNVGGQTVDVRSASGATILSLVSGTAWVVYLSDNTTLGGTWRTFQLGASVSTAVAGAMAGAGLTAISSTLNQSIQIVNISVTPITLTDDDRAKLENWTGGVGIVNLPDATVVGASWYVQIRNSGSGNLTVQPPAGQIDGAASKVFGPGTSATVVTDGTDYYTLGFGGGTAGGGAASFDYVEIDVTGSGNYTLSGVNLNRIAYKFTGALSGTRTIIVPATTQQYWVANATTGTASLYVKTAAQVAPGIEVLRNSQSILYCNGTDVVDAESSSMTIPVPIAQGGTGAITAAAARTGLGATTVGDQVFTATTQANARTAIGISAVGSTLITQTTQALMRTTGLGISAVGDTLITQTTQALMRTTGLGISAVGSTLITQTTVTLMRTAGLGATTIGEQIFTAADAAAVRTLIAVVPNTRKVIGDSSITETPAGGVLTADVSLHLVNDTASPGNWALYGTDSAGTRGWFTTSFRPRFGGIGVGTAAPAAANDINCIGNVNAAWSSDIRLKQNIQPITDALMKVRSIRGVRFDWTDDHVKSKGGEDAYFMRRRDVGVIAQEVHTVLPEVVYTQPGTQYLAVKYDHLIPLLIEAIKELADAHAS